MAKQYVMKDLGYERTPTTAMFHVDMPDGSKWDVPVQAIADSRDKFYRVDSEDTIGYIRKGSLDDSEIRDWAENDMSWYDVSEYAVKVDVPQRVRGYQEGWTNGEKEIVGAI